MYRGLIKPFFDFIIAVTMVLVLSPIYLIITIALYMEFKGKVIFKQNRIGKNNREFSIYKFKSMTEKRNSNGYLEPDNERLTKLGKLLRKSSLDELPQLLNIIKGDMSFVGPRPLLTEYLPLYDKTQIKRHEVLPGITGWAQIKGRNKLSWSEKFDLDLWYIQNQNFFLDLKIMLKTVSKVFKTEDVNQSDDIPMEKFNGKN